jgi:hypothetical protein
MRDCAAALDKVTEVWIGLAQLSQRPGTGVLLDRNLAFATVLGLADSADAFQRLIASAADHMGFDLLELEEQEPLRIRQTRCSVPAPALRLASEVNETRQVRFSPMFTWTSE